MARASLTAVSNDVITDDGSVLWSLVTGEQLEFPVTLNFVDDASQKPSNDYTYEAVVIEGLNELDGQIPTSIRPFGIQTRLVVRRPVYVGNWDQNGAYNKEEVVLYNGKYWRLLRGAGYIGSITPDLDPLWVSTTLNKIFVQFPSTLGVDWAVKANVASSVYGFFELRVTEPPDQIFSRTWKPVRGLVELLFSPTAEVSDG